MILSINKNHLQLLDFENMSFDDIFYIFRQDSLSNYNKHLLYVDSINIFYDTDFLVSIIFKDDTCLNIRNKNFVDYTFYFLNKHCKDNFIIDNIKPCLYINECLCSSVYILYKNQRINMINVPDTDLSFSIKWTMIPILITQGFSFKEANSLIEPFIKRCQQKLLFDWYIDEEDDEFVIRHVTKFLPKYMFNKLPKIYDQYVTIATGDMQYFKFPNKNIAKKCLDYLLARDVIYKMNGGEK